MLPKELSKVYDHLYGECKYGSGPVGDLFKWVKDKLVGGNVVDLCCGHGMFHRYLRDRDYKGFDFSSVVIGMNQKKFKEVYPNIQFDIFDMAKDYPVGNGQYDNIICCDALEHFYEADLPNVLNNIKSCCHDNSKIFLSISTRHSFGWQWEGEYADLHLTVWSPDMWLEYLAKNGFTILSNHTGNCTLLAECVMTKL